MNVDNDVSIQVRIQTIRLAGGSLLISAHNSPTIPPFEVDVVLIALQISNDGGDAEGSYAHACVPINNGRHIYQVKGNERPSRPWHVRHKMILP